MGTANSIDADLLGQTRPLEAERTIDWRALTTLLRHNVVLECYLEVSGGLRPL